MSMTQPQPSGLGLLRRIFHSYDRAMGRLDLVAQWAIGLALGLVFILLVTQVLVRYVLPFPLPWVEEAATYMSGYVAMIGASVCLRSSFHLQVDLLRDRLGPQLQFCLLVLQQLLVLSFGLFLLHYGIKFVELGWGQTSPSSYFLVSHARMVMPIGGLLIMLQSAALIGRAVVGILDHRPPPSGPINKGDLIDV